MELSELIESVDILEYISQYTEFTEKNGEYWGLSPLKEEKTPSFSIRKEENNFYDFSSGVGGNVLTFIRYYNKCGYQKAIEILKEYVGYQYSMGFLIGLAGHKRYAMPNAKFLLHDGSNFVFDSGAKAQDRMEFNKKMESRIKDYILSRSKLTTEEYDSKYRIEWYMFSDEAKEKGFVDFIIGVDCGLDEIV